MSTSTGTVLAERSLGATPTAARIVALIAAEPGASLAAAVVGPGGTGKTTVLDRMAAEYRRAGVQVVRGDARDRVPRDRLDPGAAVLIDDAHRLEPGFLDDLRGFADDESVRLVVAYRPWPRPRALAALTATIGPRRLVVMVGHLTRTAVADRIAERVGCRPPDEMVDLVHQQSGGLPSLVDLVAQGLVDSGRFDPRRPEGFHRPDSVTVSAGLAERLRHRVDALEPAVHDLLEALARGAGLDSDVLGPLLGGAPHELDAAVEAARATGLVVESGQVIPLIRNLFLRLTPLLRRRELQHRLAGIELDRGGSVLSVARQRRGARAHRAGGSRIAAVFEAAAEEALVSSPALAVDLLTAAVEAGTPPPEIAGRRAMAAALAGDLDGALRHTDQVISDPDAPDRAHAVTTAAAGLAHRGMLERSADLHLSLSPAGALLGVPALVATGALREARDALAAARTDADLRAATLLEGAAMLMAQGMVATVSGSGPAALSQLSRAAILLEPIASTALLPDTPAALTAVVALQCGELSVADAGLRKAIASGHGGRPSRTRHRLLHAWLMMSRGGPDLARRVLERVAAPELHLEPRDEFLAASLGVAVARRADGSGALAAAWSRARDALVQYPVDLSVLPQLGELTVAAAQLGESDWLTAHLAAADDLLDRIGRPPLWTAPLAWFHLQAAVAADRPTDVARHTSVLAGVAAASPYAAVLHAAAACWSDVLYGDTDADTVVAVARRMLAVGLGWEAAQLAGRAAPAAPDKRSTAALHAFARALQSTVGNTGAAAPEWPGGTITDVVASRDVRADTATDSPPDAPVDRSAAGPATAARPASSASEDRPTFSERELEIGRFILAGLTYKQIGERLFISAKTVEHHVARMRQRLAVASREELFEHIRTAIDADGAHPAA
ncbi:MAG: LuxR C-terminal-related transcriptional regulator [Pseudonocardia sp.]|nr:LuxR C-terminal-related transcriptional regulator [Pseudonocardia sp.]